MSSQTKIKMGGNPTVTEKWRLSAQLTSQRADLLDKQTCCMNLQRKLDLFARVYRSVALPPGISEAWEILKEFTQAEFDDKQGQIGAYDEQLDKLTSELHDFMMDGSTL